MLAAIADKKRRQRSSEDEARNQLLQDISSSLRSRADQSKKQPISTISEDARRHEPVVAKTQTGGTKPVSGKLRRPTAHEETVATSSLRDSRTGRARYQHAERDMYEIPNDVVEGQNTAMPLSMDRTAVATSSRKRGRPRKDSRADEEAASGLGPEQNDEPQASRRITRSKKHVAAADAEGQPDNDRPKKRARRDPANNLVSRNIVSSSKAPVEAARSSRSTIPRKRQPPVGIEAADEITARGSGPRNSDNTNDTQAISDSHSKQKGDDDASASRSNDESEHEFEDDISYRPNQAGSGRFFKLYPLLKTMDEAARELIEEASPSAFVRRLKKERQGIHTFLRTPLDGKTFASKDTASLRNSLDSTFMNCRKVAEGFQNDRSNSSLNLVNRMYLTGFAELTLIFIAVFQWYEEVMDVRAVDQLLSLANLVVHLITQSQEKTWKNKPASGNSKVVRNRINAPFKQVKMILSRHKDSLIEEADQKNRQVEESRTRLDAIQHEDEYRKQQAELAAKTNRMNALYLARMSVEKDGSRLRKLGVPASVFQRITTGDGEQGRNTVDTRPVAQWTTEQGNALLSALDRYYTREDVLPAIFRELCGYDVNGNYGLLREFSVYDIMAKLASIQRANRAERNEDPFADRLPACLANDIPDLDLLPFIELRFLERAV